MTVALIVLLVAMAVHCVCGIAMAVLIREPEKQARWRRPFRNSALTVVAAAAFLITGALLNLLAPHVLFFLIGWI